MSYTCRLDVKVKFTLSSADKYTEIFGENRRD